jgi:hypothetical protein
MPSRGSECFRQSWNTFVQGRNAFYSFGMLSTELEYLCTELECFLQGWHAFCRDGMLSAGLEYFLECWNSFVQG